MRKIEVCCTTIEDVVEARKGGACRVELCSALSGGGVTPSYALIRRAVAIGVPVNVLIRPREGDFCYTETEVEMMLDDIRMASELGVNGFAIGALTHSGDIDVPMLERMVDVIKQCAEDEDSVDITFHRAFDDCANKEWGLEQLIFLGCNRLLTSGGVSTAWYGRSTIKGLVQRAGDRITIMPGSGVNPGNIVELERITGAKEFHSSARGEARPSGICYEGTLFGGKPAGTSAEVVSRLVNL